MSASAMAEHIAVFEARSADAVRQKVSVAIHWKLLDDLHGSSMHLLRPAFEVALVALMLWQRTAMSLVAVWAAALLLTIAGRGLLCRLYRIGSNNAGTETWSRRFIAVAWLEAALWGATSALILLVNDPVVHLVVAAALGSNLCAVVTRNGNVPRAALGQVLLMLVPLACACFATSQPIYMGYGVLSLLQIAVSWSRIKHLHRQTVGLLQANETVAMTNTRLERANQKLAARSTMDGLTTLINRRGFDNALQREWGRAMREHRPLTVMILAIDHFQALTEALGPQAGDECLRRVADCLQLTLRRPTDAAARYGLEEFAVVLPDTDAVAAHYLSERICAAVEALGIPNPHTAGGKATVSIGYSTAIPAEGAGGSALVEQAGVALYRAMASGRHCACAWDAALDPGTRVGGTVSGLPAIASGAPAEIDAVDELAIHHEGG